MADEIRHHIMLLPRTAYWQWVDAARDYALRFHVDITPSPEKARDFHFPEQVITVIDLPDAYPETGDILAWLRLHAPGVPLDVIEVYEPYELQRILGQRMAIADRFGGVNLSDNIFPANDERYAPPPSDLEPDPEAEAAFLEEVPEFAPVDEQPTELDQPEHIADPQPNPLPAVPQRTALDEPEPEDEDAGFVQPPMRPLEPYQGVLLIWPTDYTEIVQPFAANPDLFREQGLPGHNGVDIAARLNSNVYVSAAGTVADVHHGVGGHPLGIHIRIAHPDGYETIYAHLNAPLVFQGQAVQAGQLIGLAGSTGSAVKPHLHLGLIRPGAYDDGETSYPDDSLDPTSLLVYPSVRKEPRFAPALWPPQMCLIGLNGRQGQPMTERDWQVIQQVSVEALALNSAASLDDVDRARQINPNVFLLLRLGGDFSRGVVKPRDFVDLFAHDIERFYAGGLRHVEVHSQPNLASRGFGRSWRSGREFGDWFLEVTGTLRPHFPEIQFGWPGLSTGSENPGLKRDYQLFLESAGSAVAQADWIGVNAYWTSEEEMLSERGGLVYKWYRSEWPDKLLLITEFSNPAETVEWSVKGRQILRFYQHLRLQPGVGAAFAFTLSAPHGYNNEVWRFENGEINAIPAIVAGRTL
ncbi:MAG: M23 family metallopeptidase [Chloroflexi bacterium]|nr:M23 family metallopeptidase [Chloroflexota bacterium]